MTSENYEPNVVQVMISLQELVDKNWITKNEHVQLQAVAQHLVDDLKSFDLEIEKNKRIAVMFSTMQEYFPETLSFFMENIKESKNDT